MDRMTKEFDKSVLDPTYASVKTWKSGQEMIHWVMPRPSDGAEWCGSFLVKRREYRDALLGMGVIEQVPYRQKGTSPACDRVA